MSKLIERGGRICQCAVARGVPRRSFIVALIVGTILNLINQGDALWTGTPIDVAKLLLTYLVPYFVSIYGAVSYQLHAARGSTRPSGLRPSVNKSGREQSRPDLEKMEEVIWRSPKRPSYR